MRLNTYEKRLEYLRRNRIITEIEYQEMLASPGERQGRKEKQAEVPDIGEELQPITDGIEEGAGEAPLPEEKVSAAGDEADEIKVEKDIPPVPATEKEGLELIRSEAAAGFEPKGLSGSEDEDIEMLLSDIIGEKEESGILRIDADDGGDGIVIFKVKGHLDSSSASDLENVLERAYESGVNKIIVDLAEVSYISSGGWGIFTGRVKALREGKGDVVLTSMSPEVFDIYELLGFQDVIEHFQTVEEAVQFISLPFEERQKDLEKKTSSRGIQRTLEHRMAVTEEPPADSPDSASWTPLFIEAGTVGEQGEITVLNLTGVIDTVSCLQLRDVLDDLLEKNSVKLVIDMSKVEYVSSAGWGIFASRIDDVRSRGGDIKIFGMDPEVDGIFHLLGFDVIMRSFGIFSEAIDDFGQLEPSSRTGAEEDIPPAGGDGSSGLEVVEDGSGMQDDLALVISHIESVEGSPVILKVSGAVDASTTDLFTRYLDESLTGESRHLIIDMSDLVYMSSSGWGTIIRYMQKLGKDSGRLVLAGMSQGILRIYQDLGLEPLISHHLTVEMAVESFQSSPGEAAAEKTDEVMPPAPLIEKIELPPIIPMTDKGLPELDSEYDLENIEKRTDRDDKSIKELGWEKYGEKLSRHNRNKKGKGK